MKILYVEDDPRDADLTRRSLAKLAPDNALEIARTFQEALAMLERTSDYDLVLTDLKLPDGDGLALLAHIRERRPGLAVVVVSGRGDEESAITALKAGADDYIVKRKDYLQRLPMTLESSVKSHEAEFKRHTRPLRVLYGEHVVSDIDLTRRHVARYAAHIRLDAISSMTEISRLLLETRVGERCDIVLLDYRLPGLDTLDLIKEAIRTRGVDVPIVLVTGQGSAEVAAQAIKLGAADYVVKNPGYLFQLTGVLENAFHRYHLKREQEALRISESYFRTLVETSPEAIIIVDPQGLISFGSGKAFDLFGIPPDHPVVGKNMIRWIASEEHARMQARLTEILSGREKAEMREYKLLKNDGAPFWGEISSSPWPSATEGQRGLLIICRDITERKLREEKLQRAFADLKDAIDGSVLLLASTVEAKDPYTAGHQKKVAQIASAVAGEMGMPEDRIQGIHMAGFIHDLGKIAVPAEILSKPGKLSSGEFAIIKTHSQVGYDILNPIHFPWPLAQIVLQHHERMDGSGYPQGISDGAIRLEARILAVADVVEAMSAHRPYRASLGIGKALEEIEANKARLYDPQVADACLTLFRDKGFRAES